MIQKAKDDFLYKKELANERLRKLEREKEIEMRQTRKEQEKKAKYREDVLKENVNKEE